MHYFRAFLIFYKHEFLTYNEAEKSQEDFTCDTFEIPTCWEIKFGNSVVSIIWIREIRYAMYLIFKKVLVKLNHSVKKNEYLLISQDSLQNS